MFLYVTPINPSKEPIYSSIYGFWAPRLEVIGFAVYWDYLGSTPDREPKTPLLRNIGVL